MARPTPSLNHPAIEQPRLDTATIERLRVSSFEGISDPEVAQRTGCEDMTLASLLEDIIDFHWSTIAKRPEAPKSVQSRPKEKERVSMTPVSRTALDLVVELTKLPTGLAPMPSPAWRLDALIPDRSFNAAQLADLASRVASDDTIASAFLPEPTSAGLRASARSDDPRFVRPIVKRARDIAIQLGKLADEADVLDIEDVQRLERVAARFVADTDVTLAALDRTCDVMRKGHQPNAIRREALIVELYVLRLMLTGQRDRYSKGETLAGPFGVLATALVATVECIDPNSLITTSLGDRITAAANAVDTVFGDAAMPDPSTWRDAYSNVQKAALGQLRSDEGAPVSDKRVDSTG